MEGRFVRVLVPLRLDWIPVYRSEFPLRRGQSVRVIFAGREYTGVVWESDAAPDISEDRILPVTAEIPELPDLSETEMKFWEFLSEYYLCSPCEVYRAALPAIKSGQTEIRRHKKLEARMKAKRETELLRLRDRLTSAVERIGQRLKAVDAKLAAAHRSETVMNRLEEQKGSLERQLAEKRRELSGLPPAADAVVEKKPDSINRECTPRRRALKPQVIAGTGRGPHYLEAVLKALDCGGQVLILTPESAFCDRLEAFLKPKLGDRLLTVGTASARGRTAVALQGGENIAVVSTKTGIFLPFSRLALVIIEDEQDSLYKQNDSAPRYNGRDAAIKLAELHSADVILGSPCPSLETIHNCITGKFDIIRIGGSSAIPVIVDVGEEKKKNGMSGYFSRRLVASVMKCGGPVMLIRGWEKPDELREQTALLFPGRDIRIATLTELKRQGCGDPAMIAVLQADALVSKDDFRSDERALQLVATLCGMAPEVWIQTCVRERFDGSKTAESLLAERREFGYPPYSRLVDIRREGSGETVERHFLRRGPDLAVQKRELLSTMPEGCYPDVDPA